MLRRIGLRKPITVLRKPRKLKESQVKYSTRKPKVLHPMRTPSMPLKPEEWDKYLGEYFVFFEGQILGHGHDLDKILREVEEQHGKKLEDVLLFKVPMSRRKIL